MKKKTTKENSKSVHYPDGLPENPSRLAIFVFYDKDGIVDDYIPYLLKDLKENLTDLVIVANGKLTVEGRRSFTSLTPYVYVRENMGFDAGAWKDAMLNYLGWDKIAQYDELLLINDSFYGPLYPFREVFNEMDHRPVDFWGLTAFAESSDVYEGCPYPHIPVHIQSYFLAIRNRMHTSYEFKQYWEKQPYFQSAYETIAKHEIVFTKHFNDIGFTWSVLSDTTDMDGEYCDNRPVAHCWHNTYELIKNRKCPIIKRHCFGFEYAVHLNFVNGSQLRKSMEYIANETNYDVSLIYKNLLRIYNVADIFNNLHLQYVLPKKFYPEKQRNNYRAVLVFHLYYIDMVKHLLPYFSEIPENVDVIVTTRPKEGVEAVHQCFSELLGDRLRILPIPNRGRDAASFLIAAKPYLKDYDYIGFCHDKGAHKGDPITWERDFQELLFENIAGSGAYIENLLRLLETHPEIGLLSPPPVQLGPYFTNFTSRCWAGGCLEQTKELAKRLGIKVDISENKWPLAIGTAFWCRREALAPLFDYLWTYDDFPPEPLGMDSTINHALERIFPFVAQHQGYLSGWVMTDEYAALEINNIHYRVDQLLHSGATVANIGVKGALVIYIKKHLPKPLWGIARKIKRLLRW